MDPHLDYVFDFLKDLKNNNTRAWMHQRAIERRYDIVKRTMERMVSHLLLDMSELEPTRGLKPKDCMFRIWRGTRFSKDKTPCKTYISFVIRAGGKKNERRAAYYLQLEPGGKSFIGGGLYMPEPEYLRNIRKAITADAESFEKILNAPIFKKTFGGLEELRLKTMPRGIKREMVSPAAGRMLPYTSFIASHDLTDAEVMGRNFEERIIELFTILKPFNDWLSEAV